VSALAEPAIARLRVEVADRLGSVALIVDDESIRGLSSRKRDHLDTLAACLIFDLSQILGTGKQDAMGAAIAELTRLIADEAAYERVARRRGMLPL
jgi:hypothetical protein